MRGHRLGHQASLLWHSGPRELPARPQNSPSQGSRSQDSPTPSRSRSARVDPEAEILNIGDPPHVIWSSSASSNSSVPSSSNTPSRRLAWPQKIAPAAPDDPANVPVRPQCRLRHLFGSGIDSLPIIQKLLQIYQNIKKTVQKPMFLLL